MVEKTIGDRRVTLAKDRGLSFGESNETCCFCINIKSGVIIIGILFILNALYAAFGCWRFFSLGSLAGIVMISLTLPQLLAGYYFLKFFRDMESSETKKQLPLACALQSLSAVLTGAWCVVLDIFIKEDDQEFPDGGVLSWIVTFGVMFLFFAYFYSVCKKFAFK